MKKLLGFLCVLLLCSFTLPWGWDNPFGVTATRTFFIAPNGNDANSISAAQSQSTPWRTLGPHTGSLAAGDVIMYQSGGTYFDSADVHTSNITLTSYGTGAQPIITGFYNVTSWTNLGGGIYESEAIPTNIGVNMVAINGVDYAMGRFPNAGTSNDGYLNFETHSGSTSITDNQKPPLLDATYAGSMLVMRTDHYGIARATVTGISGNTISYTGFVSSNSGSAVDGYGYFIQNDIKTLDVFGEWFYNPNTKKIDVFFGSAGPTGKTVQVAVKDKLLLTHGSNMVIDGLTYSGANYCMFSNWSGIKNVLIKNCNLLYSGFSHIGFNNMNNSTVMNTNIGYGHVNGGVWWGPDTTFTVKNCNIFNICMFPGMVIKDPNSSIVGCGVYTGNTDSVLVDANNFKNMGYIGIRMNEANNVMISNNFIDSFEMTIDDAGGIYTWGNYTRTLHDRYIINNIVRHGVGTGFGTPPNDKIWGGGIYTDDRTKNVVIEGNTVDSSTYRGLYMHNSANITVRNNTFFHHAIEQVETQHDNSSFTMTGNIFTNNKVIATSSSQLLIDLRSGFNDLPATFSRIDSNYYARGTNDNAAFTLIWFGNSSPTFNLAGWKSAMGGESHSRNTNITDLSKVIFKTNTSRNVSKDYQVCTACIGIDGNSVPNKFTLAPFSSNLIFKP